ncbi:hypothetical protein BJ878DRAFT_496693 [Calycina marina]|uniref:PhoD-like phosphatase domain-containing protein n=1 Tax=Calycina marina TaxID=1763456 RepID=A0A9P7Z6I4_9HELO|nr:hypothetical protein BJ878DRAFT_496693 [Calycina marina]
MAYYGEMPAPKVHRGNILKQNTDREPQKVSLPVSNNPRLERLSGQSSNGQDRLSTQTGDSQSPFVSPTDSSFGVDGLAPRPVSYKQAGGSTEYNKDYLDKRRQREARQRNHEVYDDEPPPSAPDVPRAPPLSYKQPYPGGSSGPNRARSARDPNDRYYEERAEAFRRESKGKDIARGEIYNNPQSRKGSVSEAEAKRSREWAADRSPLQRLELTLDSITKEEKRARIEEAEQRLQEGKSRREGAERLNQNNVRFRNRPVVKGPDVSQPDVASLPEKRAAPISNTREREPARKVSTRERPPQHLGITTIPRNGTNRDHRAEPDIVSLRSAKEATPQRANSLRGPAAVAAVNGAAVAGLGRSPSNKLRKDPPGDPWHNIQVEAKNIRTINPISPRDKKFPPIPAAAKQPSYQQSNYDSETDSDLDFEVKPVHRGNMRKVRQLTGEDTVGHPQRSASVSQPRGPANAVTAIGRSNSQRVPGKVPSDAAAGAKDPLAAQHRDRHFASILHHRDEDVSGQTVYTPIRRLDEWKKGGAVLLDRSMLDLDAIEKTEAEKDRAWWEAGNKTQRRQSTTSQQRRAEAYNGEYENSAAPTRFKPRIFLRSGPLLRYCGLRQEKKQGRIPKDAPRPSREIWRGSVMIVTQDDQSSYELVPTLRLFVQPMDLIPPPPEQVKGEMEDVAPQYIDPIAGLPKVGRDGRTLYIRPVDHLEEGRDVSKLESDEGLFEMQPRPVDGDEKLKSPFRSHVSGEQVGKYKEIRGFRLHAERGVTFWKFNIEIELRQKQQRIAYRINRGPATGFWVPARDQAMNIMFHSCNGFSAGVDSNTFNGPDPMWRDVLNTHQTQPFHVMLGGGDQIYNDCVQLETTLFREWTQIPANHQHQKLHHPFTAELQNELETFYLNRYSMWFSQGLFGVAVSQIPMINIFDDHDIYDGFGSYSDYYMKSPVISGLGAVAFKYYMLFQHQTSVDEGEETEPSWILGADPGPYIPELSRSIFTFLGRSVAFLGLDCRTERMYDEVVSPETYDRVFARLMSEIQKGETKHLIVLLGVPVAYPRMVWLENILTSRLMEPVKAMSRAGLFGKKLLNHLDGGVEILDDLDDHWTAKHHKDERHFFIEELQDLAAEKSVRVTILGGDVHLAAIGQFYSSPKLEIPKDRDHRYMPNIISSAIVNTPPPDTLADLLNKRNKVHHLDEMTDENMIPIFTHDVTGKPRNNKRLLNRRNWCSIREYNPELTPPPTPEEQHFKEERTPPPKRGGLRHLSTSARGPNYRPDAAATDRPPVSNTSFFTRRPSISSRRGSTDSERPGVLTRTLSLTRKDFMPASLFRLGSKKRRDDNINGYGSESEDDAYTDDDATPPQRSGLRGGGGDDVDDNYFPRMSQSQPRNGNNHTTKKSSLEVATSRDESVSPRRQTFHRIPTGLSTKQLKRGGHDVNLEGGLDICLNVEVNQRDPAGITVPYRLLVPQLWYEGEKEGMHAKKMRGGMKRWLRFTNGGGKRWKDEGDGSEEEYEDEDRRGGSLDVIRGGGVG